MIEYQLNEYSMWSVSFIFKYTEKLLTQYSDELKEIDKRKKHIGIGIVFYSWCE